MEEQEFGEEAREEEVSFKVPYVSPEPISVCKCLRDDESSEKVEISSRKQQILSTVARTESYLRERRIPELIRFLLTKMIADASPKPVSYLQKLLDDCMLFRAGLGLPPVIYERRHLEAVVKSFDPGERGWLSPGQVKRAYITLGLPPREITEEKIPTEEVLNELERVQERELYHLVTAGSEREEESSTTTSSSQSQTRTYNCKRLYTSF